MSTDPIWKAQLHLVAHSFHADRDNFNYASETYDNWSWLALERGHFAFRIGSGEEAIAGECGAGEWVLCPPHTRFWRHARETMAFHFMRFDFEEEEPPRTMRGRQTLRDSTRLRLNFAQLRETQYQPQAAFWKAHLLLDLLRARHFESLSTAHNIRPDQAMQQIGAWIETHLAEKISFQELAAQARLTPSSFSRRFKAATGQPPQQFLLQKRLDAARQLLLSTDWSLDVVAARCGFANGFYFSRLWTQQFGIAPARFRRLHRM
jgi:AraC-like DNA-binding protein